jgi:hypothetical protein
MELSTAVDKILDGDILISFQCLEIYDFSHVEVLAAKVFNRLTSLQGSLKLPARSKSTLGR